MRLRLLMLTDIVCSHIKLFLSEASALAHLLLFSVEERLIPLTNRAAFGFVR